MLKFWHTSSLVSVFANTPQKLKNFSIKSSCFYTFYTILRISVPFWIIFNRSFHKFLNVFNCSFKFSSLSFSFRILSYYHFQTYRNSMRFTNFAFCSNAEIMQFNKNWMKGSSKKFREIWTDYVILTRQIFLFCKSSVSILQMSWKRWDLVFLNLETLLVLSAICGWTSRVNILNFVSFYNSKIILSPHH